MKVFCMIAAAAASLSFATPVLSASITLTDINGIWSSSQPVADGLGSSEIRWGRPAETRQSGYNFSSSTTPFSVEDQQQFVIGQFTHENFPVFDTFLQSADLAVEFMVDGVNRAITSTFSFDHLETPNLVGQGGLCPDGEPNGSGLNVAGCADRVTATLNRAQSESFEIGGVSYVLDILGFQQDGRPLTNFWTQENLSNEADLVAIFRVEEDPPVVTDVPLPASGFLILIGLASLTAARRRA